MGVVAGTLKDTAVAQQINAAVANVGPVGTVILNQADGTGRAGPMVQSMILP